MKKRVLRMASRLTLPTAVLAAFVTAAPALCADDRFGPPPSGSATPTSPSSTSQPAPAATIPPATGTPWSADPAAAQAFERIYGARVRAAAKTPARADDVELAKELLADEAQTSAEPALRAVMLNKAYELGLTDCAGVPTAVSAAQKLAAMNAGAPATTDEMLLRAYEEQSRCPGTDLKKLAPLYLDKITVMADERLKREDYEGAIALYQRGTPAAKLIDAKRLEQNQAAIKALKAREPFVKQAQGLRRSLEKSPDRKRAAELVRLLLVELDDPGSAAAWVPMLADPGLGRVVRTVVPGTATPTEADERAAGVWYRAQANHAVIGKATALARARSAYERALAQHAAHDEAWLELRAAVAEAIAAQEKLARDEEAARQREAKAHEPHPARTARSGSPARAANPGTARPPPGGYDN